MFITIDQDGLVKGYSDGLRNPHNLAEGERQVEVDMEFMHIDCKEFGLTFKDGKLLNAGEVIASEIEKKPIPEEGPEGFEQPANQES